MLKFITSFMVKENVAKPVQNCEGIQLREWIQWWSYRSALGRLGNYGSTSLDILKEGLCPQCRVGWLRWSKLSRYIIFTSECTSVKSRRQICNFLGVRIWLPRHRQCTRSQISGTLAARENIMQNWQKLIKNYLIKTNAGTHSVKS